MAFTAGTPIHVVARTIPAARAALTMAANMAQALGSRLHVIAAGPRLLDAVQLFSPGSIVVVGGHSRRLWPTAEQRLARALTTRGCHVLFVSGGSR